MRLPTWISAHLAALRALAVFTVVLGIAYPLLITAVAQLPGLKANAHGSIVERDGRPVGSTLLGQAFDGHPGYFRSRPSAAGAGYDPTATSASNLGPESVVDTLGDPALDPDSTDGDGGKRSLLTQVCTRSKEVGEREGVDGSRPFCTSGGLGAVLAVFRAEGLNGPITRVVSLNETATRYDAAAKAPRKDEGVRPFLDTYQGVRVELAVFGEDYSKGVVTPVRGAAPDKPAVPADAVTASGSGLDPDITPEYAKLQLARVAKARDTDPATLAKLVDEHTTGRALGFIGEPAVNVLELNLALDQRYP
ncbi:potassium-transporting ATPase subunit C [Longispora sp. NPDC051575]|uniref:potassium-transporting ATPase subunit C n=1 Tax=Longispora sp. NPDC051575 TaxID=3154943 RepID=UPI00343F9702